MPRIFFFLGSEFTQLKQSGFLSQDSLNEAVRYLKTKSEAPPHHKHFDEILLFICDEKVCPKEYKFDPAQDVIIAASAGGRPAKNFIEQVNQPCFVAAFETVGLTRNFAHSPVWFFEREALKNAGPIQEKHIVFHWIDIRKILQKDKRRDLVGHAPYMLHPNQIAYLQQDDVPHIELKTTFGIAKFRLYPELKYDDETVKVSYENVVARITDSNITRINCSCFQLELVLKLAYSRKFNETNNPTPATFTTKVSHQPIIIKDSKIEDSKIKDSKISVEPRNVESIQQFINNTTLQSTNFKLEFNGKHLVLHFQGKKIRAYPGDQGILNCLKQARFRSLDEARIMKYILYRFSNPKEYYWYGIFSCCGVSRTARLTEACKELNTKMEKVQKGLRITKTANEINEPCKSWNEVSRLQRR